MKTYFFCLMFSLGLSQGVLAQNQQQVADIDKAKQEIDNNVGNFHKIDEFKDSNGYTYVYKNDKELTLITLYRKDQNIDKHVEWYFMDGKMIYAEQTWADNKTSKLIDNERLYFSSGHLINLISNGKTVDTDSKKFSDADNAVAANRAWLETKYASK